MARRVLCLQTIPLVLALAGCDDSPPGAGADPKTTYSTEGYVTVDLGSGGPRDGSIAYPDANANRLDAGDASGSSPDSGPRGDLGPQADLGSQPDLGSQADLGSQGDLGMGDSGRRDLGPRDTGIHPDAQIADAGQFPMSTARIQDSASSGTPDTYQFNVAPGSPFEASITGGGNGSWHCNVYGATTNVLLCSAANCAVTVPANETVIFLTAVTDDIGAYTMLATFSGSRR